MDVFSAAASGIAVLSLSIQLIESVDSIHSFIKAFKAAPTEIERLIRILGQLRTLLEDVKDVFEHQASLQWLPAIPAAVLGCLKECENCLLPLQKLISKYHGSLKSSKLKTWAWVRLGLKAKDIMGYETRIQQAIVTLSAAMTVNCTRIQ